MKLDKDKNFVQTWIGTLLTMVVFVIITAYGIQKMDVWLTKKAIDIASSVQQNFYSDDFVFDFNQGMNLAMAFTAYDDEQEPILDKSYGEIIF